MNKRIINRYIPIAMKVIDKEIENKDSDLINNDKSIKGVYKGYISSFGASIIQSGLIATIAFFKNTESSSEGNKELVIKLIEKILKKDKKINKNDKLLEVAIKSGFYFTQDVKNAAVALKLSLKTYRISKED